MLPKFPRTLVPVTLLALVALSLGVITLIFVRARIGYQPEELSETLSRDVYLPAGAEILPADQVSISTEGKNVRELKNPDDLKTINYRRLSILQDTRNYALNLTYIAENGDSSSVIDLYRVSKQIYWWQKGEIVGNYRFDTGSQKVYFDKTYPNIKSDIPPILAIVVVLVTLALEHLLLFKSRKRQSEPNIHAAGASGA